MFGQRRIRRLSSLDRQDIQAFCLADPVDRVLIGNQVMQARSGAYPAYGVFSTHHTLEALCWVGGNVIPVGFHDEDIPDLAHMIDRSGINVSSLVGPAHQVLTLSEYLGYEVREVRARQYSMLASQAPSMPPDTSVRPARSDEIDAVFPAAVAMYQEELGYDPRSLGSSYLTRAKALLAKGHTLVKIDHGNVIFKADVGALFGSVAQVQGVWVDPRYRGQGIGRACMAAAVSYIQAHIAPQVSLYVNDYNVRAVNMYQAVGFRVVGHWATVLL